MRRFQWMGLRRVLFVGVRILLGVWLGSIMCWLGLRRLCRWSGLSAM